MREESYLVTTSIGERSRKVIWHPREPLDLDFPAHWVLRKGEAGIEVVEKTPTVADEPTSYVISPRVIRRHGTVRLPLPHDEDAYLSLEIRKLKSIRPAYLPEKRQSRRSSSFFLFGGSHDLVFEFARILQAGSVLVGARAIFSFAPERGGFDITAHVDGVFLRIGNEDVPMPVAVPYFVAEADLVRGTLHWRHCWWRVKREPMIEPLMVTGAPTAHGEKRWMTRAMQGIVALSLGLFLVAQWLPAPRRESKRVVAQTQIALKQPKWAPPPPKPEAPPPPPPKVERPKPPPVAPPRTVDLTKKPASSAPPAKKVARGEPARAPRKVERAAPPPRAERPAPRPAARPDPAVAQARAEARARADQARAQARAEAQARAAEAQARAAQAKAEAQARDQVAKAFDFVSPSASRPAAPLPRGDEGAKYDGVASDVVSSGPGKKGSVLNDMASGPVASGGKISTRSARNIGSADGEGDRRGRGVGRVHGRVASGAVHDGGGGGGTALSGGGLSVTGSGSVDESELAKVLEQNLSKFQYCYEKALLADPSLAGTLVMQWTLSTSGAVSGARAVRSELNNSALHACVAGVLQTLRFPAPKGGSVNVKYPFAFASGSL